ncbi:MAG: hypothetical protein LBP62_08020 [Clostridiales bacterium]|jgi:hypothetical protein|nr:hypothetical protein [Clostridiales bacterium]
MKAKRVNYKRVLLVVVEGQTDKVSLENIFKRRFTDKKVCFLTVRGDLTAEEDTTPDNAAEKISGYISGFLAKNRAFERTDIIEIVHLTDLDGAFLSAKRLVYDADSDTVYGKRTVTTGKTIKIAERNARKSAVLSRLSSLSNIGGIKYSLYYFSANLEHVLYNSANLNGREKEEAAFNFAKSFQNKEGGFVDFLRKQRVLRDFTYGESWEYVQKGANSLKRLTNINLFFERAE